MANKPRTSQTRAKKPTTSRSPETKLIKELAKILDTENLSEIELEKGDLRLRVTRQLTGGVPMVAAPVAAPIALRQRLKRHQMLTLLTKLVQ